MDARLVLNVVLMALALCAPAGAGPGCGAAPGTDWRTTLDYPNDQFFFSDAYSPDEPRWVKFTIMLCDPSTVYFHNGYVHRFHYDFARAKLSPFAGWTRQQFDDATLHAQGQQAVLGAVLIPGFGLFGGFTSRSEMAIQLVRQDAYTREQVRDWFNLVKSKVAGSNTVPVLYFPTFEQQASAEDNRAWLAGQGIEVASPSRWITRNTCYANGWAIGRLKFVPGALVGDAYRAGTLRPEDILITDGVAAEVPPVAGIITTAPATPNSHVALLSQTWGIPFVYLAEEVGQSAMGLVGRRVILRSYDVNYACRADFADAEDLPAAVLSDLAALKQIPPLAYAPMQRLPGDVYVTGVDALTPDDTPRVGGKAANYGVLRREIPGNARPAAAIGFRLWQEFLDQRLINGLTLRQQIDSQLAPHATWPPTDPGALATTLANVRSHFTNTSLTRFTAAQESAILAALQSSAYGFDPDVKLRFRSSTNVEDTASFTGAGLYDSFSGCLRDDLDADQSGPSVCDPTEANERGVFRAIRKVFASFYNDNAYQARVRLGVDEDEVGMAMLVHHSFPDPTELANGVAVYEYTPGNGGGGELSIVSQVGATSVTNPDDGSTPEEVFIYITGFGMYPELRTSSSQTILGEYVMNYPTDYENLGAFMSRVAAQYAVENQLTSRFTLDFEFKKTTVGGSGGPLEIKQVRPLPQPGGTPSITPVLVNRPTRYCSFQGENGEVFGVHRLKSDLLLSTDSERLSGANLGNGFLAAAALRTNSGCRVMSMGGAPATWPGAAWNVTLNGNGWTATQRWRVAGVDNPRTYTLTIESIPGLVSPAQSPVVWMEDFGDQFRHTIRLRADYDQPVPMVNWDGTIITTTVDEALLAPCPDPDGLPVERYIEDDGVSIHTRFRWVPGGAAAGYTFDLASWDGTTISGLTSRPIELRGYWSQTYRPGHHNFTEDFIFDPRLEPGIAPGILQELAQQGVAYLLVHDAGTFTPSIRRMSDACLPCPADWDSSGGVAVGDVFAFLAGWFGGDARADWDGSGTLGVQDVFEFLSAFFAGC